MAVARKNLKLQPFKVTQSSTSGRKCHKQIPRGVSTKNEPIELVTESPTTLDLSAKEEHVDSRIDTSISLRKIFKMHMFMAGMRFDHLFYVPQLRVLQCLKIRCVIFASPMKPPIDAHNVAHQHVIFVLSASRVSTASTISFILEKFGR